MKVWKSAKRRVNDRIGRGVCTFSVRVRNGMSGQIFARARFVELRYLENRVSRISGYIGTQTWRKSL